VSIWRRQIQHILHAIETPEHHLALLAALLERVERERFTSVRLAALQQALITDGVPPSRRIAQLRSIVSWLDSTHNLMFAPIAYVLLVRPQLAVAINRWHRAYGPAVGEWLRAVGELEALAAIATCAYEHPDDPFPTIVPGMPLFDAAALAHPLLPAAVSVPNDVSLGGPERSAPQVLVVSGSNMSGKSTLLRAVGVNVVLALAGAPVRAKSLRLSPLAIGATLRIEDSLQEGHSRFYTEILRIRSIVDLASGESPVLFLLDEILHGTNSYDRRIGAEAIVRALVGRGAIGLVTTHDLALTELTTALGSAAANVHFEDRIEGGAMVFDYKMRPGVVERSNALALMRAVGLDV
jgi:DNA mismatch repair ATPase MutS